MSNNRFRIHGVMHQLDLPQSYSTCRTHCHFFKKLSFFFISLYSNLNIPSLNPTVTSDLTSLCVCVCFKTVDCKAMWQRPMASWYTSCEKLTENLQIRWKNEQVNQTYKHIFGPLWNNLPESNFLCLFGDSRFVYLLLHIYYERGAFSDLLRITFSPALLDRSDINRIRIVYYSDWPKKIED